MKRFLVFILVAVIILTAAVTAAGVYALKLNQPPGGMPAETVFRVSRGDNAGVIAANLEDQGLIRSGSFFKIYVRLRNTASQLKTGLYRIGSGMTTAEIHSILLQGSEELFKVAIPPGLTSNEIGQILESNGIVGREAFLEEVGLRNADGFLFPDTYSFPKEYPAEKVVGYMQETFYDAVKEVFPGLEELTEEEVLERVVMASIVEREYRAEEEASKIASVFYNRIEENMYLGSCATVVYIITELQGKTHPEKLFYRDLDIESPYNTYRNKGLPPGPICNPGITALDAAFNPAQSDYLYFLLEDAEQGTHTFSRNLAEHNRSYELYIKGK